MVVLAIGATACGLLTLRQSRLQAASELAQAQLRIGTSDERLWALRSQIAERVTPSNVERMAASVGPLKPIIAPPLAIPSPGDALPKLAYESDVPGAPRKLQIVSNTASGQRDLAPAAEAVGPVAKVMRTPETNTAPKADSKSPSKAGAKPAAKPAPSGKKATPTKPPPVDTLIRADAGGSPVKVALAATSKKPAASAKASEKPGAKATVKAAGKAANSAKPTTVVATSKKQKSAEPKATQIAMQPERR
jgi:hypothetical protein